MESVIDVCTQNSKPSMEFECDKTEKKVCTLIMYDFSALLTDPRYIKEYNHFILSSTAISSLCFCSSKILEGAYKSDKNGRWYMLLSLILITFPKISKRPAPWKSMSNGLMFVSECFKCRMQHCLVQRVPLAVNYKLMQWSFPALFSRKIFSIKRLCLCSWNDFQKGSI